MFRIIYQKIIELKLFLKKNYCGLFWWKKFWIQFLLNENYEYCFLSNIFCVCFF